MQNSTVIVRVFIFVSTRPFDAHQLGLKNKLFQGLFLDNFSISYKGIDVVSKKWYNKLKNTTNFWREYEF